MAVCLSTIPLLPATVEPEPNRSKGSLTCKFVVSIVTVVPATFRSPVICISPVTLVKPSEATLNFSPAVFAETENLVAAVSVPSVIATPSPAVVP